MSNDMPLLYTSNSHYYYWYGALSKMLNKKTKKHRTERETDVANC